MFSEKCAAPFGSEVRSKTDFLDLQINQGKKTKDKSQMYYALMSLLHHVTHLFIIPFQFV